MVVPERPQTYPATPGQLPPAPPPVTAAPTISGPLTARGPVSTASSFRAPVRDGRSSIPGSGASTQTCPPSAHSAETVVYQPGGSMSANAQSGMMYDHSRQQRSSEQPYAGQGWQDYSGSYPQAQYQSPSSALSPAQAQFDRSSYGTGYQQAQYGPPGSYGFNERPRSDGYSQSLPQWNVARTNNQQQQTQPINYPLGEPVTRRQSFKEPHPHFNVPNKSRRSRSVASRRSHRSSGSAHLNARNSYDSRRRSVGSGRPSLTSDSERDNDSDSDISDSSDSYRPSRRYRKQRSTGGNDRANMAGSLISFTRGLKTIVTGKDYE